MRVFSRSSKSGSVAGRRALGRAREVGSSRGRATTRALRRLADWRRRRDAVFIARRLFALLRRYGISRGKAKRRARACVELLAAYGCHPTLPTPGRLARSSGAFIRELEQAGTEFAVHGYDHVDFRQLSASEANVQFVRAVAEFSQSGITVEGFRCPYLSYEDRLLEAVPPDLKYSSNRGIWWEVGALRSVKRTRMFATIERLYGAESSAAAVSVPRMTGHVLEIPASLPDDLQLFDGLKLRADRVLSVWVEILRETHRRGELFTTVFHPEAFDDIGPALEGLLKATSDLTPRVWVTQLRHVNDWWRRKANFSVSVLPGSIAFTCSDDATVLVRDLASDAKTFPWDGRYRVLRARALRFPSRGERPIIGLAPGIPSSVAAFLRNEGYVIDASDGASRCSVFLDAQTAVALRTEVDLVNWIEASPGPLVRFWRWPQGAKSALCITGDFDALTLVDYALRFLRP